LVFFVWPPFGESSQSDRAMHERKVREKERKGRCVEYLAPCRDTVNENSRVRTELGEEPSLELKERKPLGRVICVELAGVSD